MLVSPRFAKKYKFDIKSRFHIIGGSLNRAKLCLIDPSEGSDDIDYSVDYENVFGTNLNILDNLSKIFISFPKAKVGNNGQRITALVAGPSGCGKSTFCINYMNVFRHQMPNADKYPIYFLTTITDDKRVDAIKGCHIVDLKDDAMIDYYLVNPDTRLTCQQDFFGISPLNNALVVVDDAENMSKSLQLVINELLSNIMKYGRHSNTSLLWSRHVINNRNPLIQESLSELMYIVLFRNISHKRATYFVENYLDYPKELVHWIRKGSNCRYTIVHNRCPNFILNEDRIQVLTD